MRTLSGTATIEPVYPISGTQLLNLVKQLDSSKFTGLAASMYQELVSQLESPSVVLKLNNSGMDFHAPALLGETNSSQDPFFYRIPEIPSLLNLNATLFFSENFCGECEWGFDVDNLDEKRSDKFLSVFTDFETNQMGAAPNRAYGSFGFDGYNITFGRDRVSEGMGISSNMALAENFYSEDYVKASYQNDKLSYDLTWIDYDDITGGGIDFTKETKQVIQHRVSASLFNRVTVSLVEGAIVYTSNLFNDPKVLNPFFIMHNWGSYYSGKTNNWFEVELSTQLLPAIEINGQVFVDQIQLPGESDASGKTAFGVIANLKKAWCFDKSILTGYAEFAYTNEYCYLRGTGIGYGTSVSGYNYKNCDLFVQLSDIDHQYNLAPIGYVYGTDVKAVSAGVSLEKQNRTYFADAMYILDGPNGGYKNENRDLSNISNNTTEKTIRLSIGTKGLVNDAVSYSLKVGFGYHENFQHTQAEGFIEPEYAISVVIDPVAFLKSFKTTI